MAACIAEQLERLAARKRANERKDRDWSRAEALECERLIARLHEQGFRILLAQLEAVATALACMKLADADEGERLRRDVAGQVHVTLGLVRGGEGRPAPHHHPPPPAGGGGGGGERIGRRLDVMG